MAVQAQYPSNVLFLNRNAQEGIPLDCSLQPQPGGRFLHHPNHMLFYNEGAAATRKRGRESSAATNVASSGHMICNPITLQPQPQPYQLIELSQLHYSHGRPTQSNVVSTGLRLSSTDQHKHTVSSFLSSDDFATQLRHQRDEIDQFLRAQGEQLRRNLAEKRQRHYLAILSVAEETVARRLRQKEAEVEEAARRNAELEARAAQLGIEAQAWQAKAMAEEAAATALQAQLRQAMISGGGQERSSPGECGGGSDAESVYVDPERAVAAGEKPGWCKGCRRKAVAVVMLPCRHLCLCPECDRVAKSCPVCFAARESSVEVFFH